MASLLLKPLVCDYLDVVAHAENLEFRLEEMEIRADSPLRNQSIKEANIRQRTGTLVLAVKKRDGQLITNPSTSTQIEEGDNLIVVGTPVQLEAFENMVK